MITTVDKDGSESERYMMDVAEPDPGYPYETLFTIRFGQGLVEKAFTGNDTERCDKYEQHLYDLIETTGKGKLVADSAKNGRCTILFYTRSDLKADLPNILNTAPRIGDVSTSARKDPAWTLFMDMVKKYSAPPKASR